MGKLAIGVVVCLAVAGCKGGGRSSSDAITAGIGEYGGVFQAYVAGVLKDGVINIQYQTGNTGEFEVDDTNGPLGGSKNMTYSYDGTTAVVSSVECPGDTFRIRHNTRTGGATFDGVLCGTNITGGTATLVRGN